MGIDTMGARKQLAFRRLVMDRVPTGIVEPWLFVSGPRIISLLMYNYESWHLDFLIQNEIEHTIEIVYRDVSEHVRQ